jgi:hypothetical protein
MNALERPIAHRLARQVSTQGLTLDYLDCPPWHKSAPTVVMHCLGYLDGLVSKVRVRLTREKNDSMSFRATLQSGIIATKNLVDKLVSQGYDHVDCGDVPAYPTRVGTRLVCAVSRDGRRHYVAATVANKAGAVDITGY